jgi:DnaJ-class molecular chaperone
MQGIRARLALLATLSATCPRCSGAGGSTESEQDGTVVRQVWRSCASCSGSGQI